MIGHRVIIVTLDGFPAAGQYDGVLHKLDAAGATIWRFGQMPEQEGNLFVPMNRIKEILDKGRPA